MITMTDVEDSLKLIQNFNQQQIDNITKIGKVDDVVVVGEGYSDKKEVTIMELTNEWSIINDYNTMLPKSYANTVIVLNNKWLSHDSVDAEDNIIEYLKTKCYVHYNVDGDFIKYSSILQ